MTWQDIIITIGTLLFSYAILPQVYHGFKTKKGVMTIQTALLTTIGLSISSIAFLSLGLLFSGIITLINSILWLILLIQKLNYKYV